MPGFIVAIYISFYLVIPLNYRFRRMTKDFGGALFLLQYSVASYGYCSYWIHLRLMRQFERLRVHEAGGGIRLIKEFSVMQFILLLKY